MLASPAYLARTARRPVRRAGAHSLLGFTAPASLNIWPLRRRRRRWRSAPAVTASSGETLRHLALAGAGIVCLADFLTRDDLRRGALVPVLAPPTLAWSQPVWAVFYKQGALAPRVAALVDFLPSASAPCSSLPSPSRDELCPFDKPYISPRLQFAPISKPLIPNGVPFVAWKLHALAVLFKRPRQDNHESTYQTLARAGALLSP